jgi:hypothetical protein
MDGAGPSFEGIAPDTMNRLETELYNDEEMRPVTGPPSRNGWKVRLHFYYSSSASSFNFRLSMLFCRVRPAMPVFDLATTESEHRVICDEVCLFPSVNKI